MDEHQVTVAEFRRFVRRPGTSLWRSDPPSRRTIRTPIRTARARSARVPRDERPRRPGRLPQLVVVRPRRQLASPRGSWKRHEWPRPPPVTHVACEDVEAYAMSHAAAVHPDSSPLAGPSFNVGQPGEKFPRRVVKGGSHLCAPNYARSGPRPDRRRRSESCRSACGASSARPDRSVPAPSSVRCHPIGMMPPKGAVHNVREGLGILNTPSMDGPRVRA